MSRLLAAPLKLLMSRAVPPVVIGCFFIIYVGIAFFTDETLITLMAFTRKSLFLDGLLALIPLNYALRILREAGRQIRIRHVMAGRAVADRAELFDETVSLPAAPLSRELQDRLAAAGYRTRLSETACSAWRGVSIFPARLLFMTGCFCLFAGILVSITSRTVQRQMVVEGEPLATASGNGGMVERIVLADGTGAILRRTLTMEVAPSQTGHGRRSFGIYPPALYDGSFVYPRYLGLAAWLQFTAPDLPTGAEIPQMLNCYPPGKEASVAIPGSAYKIVFSLPEPPADSDRYQSYMAPQKTLRFKLLQGGTPVLTGELPSGGEYAANGYRLALPEVRRMVVTDFIGDYGVLFIWAAGLLFAGAVCLWLPLRLFAPRRELVFTVSDGVTIASSRSEGDARRHAGVFHEALDLIAAGNRPDGA